MFVYWRYGGAPPPPSSRQSGNKLISWTAATWLQDKNASHPPPIKTGICSYRKHCQTFQQNFPSRLFDAVLLPIQGVFEKNCITQWWNVCRQFNFAVQVGHQSPSWPKNCGQVHSTGRSARTPTIIFTAFKGKLTNQIKWSLLRFSTLVLFCEFEAWALGNTMPLIDFIHKICNLLIPCEFFSLKALKTYAHFFQLLNQDKNEIKWINSITQAIFERANS